MPREIHVHLDLKMTPRAVIGGIAAFIVLAFSGELGSESVTLTTYYPAPAGVYTQLMATNNTYLAKTSGFVSIGVTNPTTTNPNPANKLSVQGSVAIGDSNYVQVNMQAAPMSTNPGYVIIQRGLGVGVTDPRASVEFVGGLNVLGSAGEAAADRTSTRGRLYVSNNNTGCWSATVAGCGGVNYATFVDGVYVNGYQYNNRGSGRIDAYYGPAGGQFNTATSYPAVWVRDGGNGGQWGMLSMAAGLADAVIPVRCCPK